MKKLAAIVCAGLLGSTGLFALPDFHLSISGGLQGATEYLARKAELKGDYVFSNTGDASTSAYISDISYFGGFLSVDFTYFKTDISIMISSANGSETILQFAGYFKYPFALADIIVFPLLGVGYGIVLENEDSYGNRLGSTYNAWYFYDNGTRSNNKVSLDDLNTLWVSLGIGGDLFIRGNVFLRSEYLLGIAPLNNYYDNLKKERYPHDIGEFEYMINFHQTVKFSIGYRF